MYFHFASSDNNSYVGVRLTCNILITLKTMEKRPKKANTKKQKKSKTKIRKQRNKYDTTIPFNTIKIRFPTSV